MESDNAQDRKSWRTVVSGIGIEGYGVHRKRKGRENTGDKVLLG
jgi:hypothetical protein